MEMRNGDAYQARGNARTHRVVPPPVTLDMTQDAPGDFTCSCAVGICDWDSWATDKIERALKERAHVEAEHPSHLWEIP